MSSYGGWGVPGTGSILETTEVELFWGGDRAKGLVLETNGNYSGAIRDAGNTPTTVIRPGLLVGKLDSGAELEEWDPAAVDGTQQLFGVVPVEFRAQDFDATNQDRVLGVIVRGALKTASLLIAGSALDGHADEYLARRQLHAMGCILDDDPQGYKAGAGSRLLVKATDYTVVADDNGTTFTTRGAGGAVKFTLPAIKRGLEFTFINEADQDMTIEAETADTLVVFNDLAADSVAYATASEKIGGAFKVVANDNASKFLVTPLLAAETQTLTIVTA